VAGVGAVSVYSHPGVHVPTEPFISLVTPFHNTEPYLAECIESVLAQTHRSFEYILVDNQSTDASGVIASAYAKKDDRIRLLRTDRLLSQVENYNFALGQISAESIYCKMVQADDWLLPMCVREMVALAEGHPRVAVVSSYRLIENEVSGLGLEPMESVLPGSKACRLCLFGRAFLFGSPTTVLYRSDVVRSRTPFFELGRFHEDTEALFDVLYNREFGFVHKVLSFSRRQTGSLMASAHDFAPGLLDRLILVKRYGQTYLSPQEHAACLADSSKWYYRALAARWLRERAAARNDAFWQYQRDGLATVGEVLRPELLAISVAATVLRTVRSPRSMLRHARASLARRRRTEATR
jgi:glycosyltransferase involved in cell wall biosynthesis